MTQEFYRRSLALAVFGALLFPTLSSAQTLGPGCRLSTAADLQAMSDRGIPQKFEVCPADLQILGIGKDFDQWYTQLKSQSPCNMNTCTLSCRTRNTGAQVCGPTATRWNSIGCHPNNNTAIFPSVPYGFAAHIELLRRYCGERGRCTIISAIQQWAGDASAHSAYAAFVSKNAGIPVNQVYNPNDVDLMARLAMSMACFEAGALPYSASDLKQGLAMASGGARMPVPANVGQLLNESLMGSYVARPVGTVSSSPGSWAYPPSSISGPAYTPPPPPASPLPIINTAAANSTNQPTSPSTQPPGTNPTQNTATTFPSTSLIIAQPASIKKGDRIVVSWTSTGMNVATPCQIFVNDTQIIGGGNEGTFYIQTDSTTGSLIKFSESCTSPAGIVSKNTSVILR